MPLWCSVIIINIWSICSYVFQNWCKGNGWKPNILNVLENTYIEIGVTLISIILPLLGMVFISKFLKNKNKTKNKPIANIISAKKANKLTAEFLLAYILPMIAFDFSSCRDLVLFVIYFLVLATLCIRNDNIYTNIYLEAKKYKLYECDVERIIMGDKYVYKNSMVISKKDITEPTNSTIQYYDCENYIYINLTDEEKKDEQRTIDK